MFKIIDGQHVNTNQITRIFGTSKGLELSDRYGQESIILYYVITVELSSGSMINTDTKMQDMVDNDLIEEFKKDKPSVIIKCILEETLQNLVGLFMNEVGIDVI